MGRAWDGFAALIGLKPRNLFVFLFFLVSALALLMVILVLVAYAGVYVDALRGLATSGPADGVKVFVGLLEFFVFLWFRVRSVRKIRRVERAKAERKEARRAEAEAEAAEPDTELTDGSAVEMEPHAEEDDLDAELGI